MPRIARLVLPDYPHHVTQRGNYQQTVFKTEMDYKNYINLLKKYMSEYSLSILSFCLMPNHVHSICIPHNESSLANTFKLTHMVYSQYFNKKNNVKGHLWQSRFFSSILDEKYLYAAVRYVERNPVRAGLANKPWDWKWSSAYMRVNKREDSGIPLTDLSKFIEVEDWEDYLSDPEDGGVVKIIRKNTLIGKPCGDDSFIKRLEKIFEVNLTQLRRGRPSLK